MLVTDISECALPPATIAAYSLLVEHLGCASFETALSRALTTVAPWTRYYIFGDDWLQPGSLHLSRCEAEIERLIPLYQQQYLPHDPLQSLLRAEATSGETILLRLPTALAPVEYREKFLERQRIVERVTVVHRTPQHCFGLSISRHLDQGCCSRSEIDALIGLGPLIGPLLQKHRQLSGIAAGKGWNIAEYERRFAELHPQLTPRERQVCARAAGGMSLEATSIDMRLAVSSVVTYRRRAYQRLSISSANELPRLIMR